MNKKAEYNKRMKWLTYMIETTAIVYFIVVIIILLWANN